MWVKYKEKRINLNNLTYFANYDYGIEYLCCGSDEIFWLNFENKKQQEKALRLIDNYIALGYWVCECKNKNCHEKYNLLDLSKEFGEQE